MLNFSNLNDVEFEYLCKDVLSRVLDLELERFGPGADGGIDLTDDASQKNVIVQVKHYTRTDADGLIRSLKKELPKLEKTKPKSYYVCCSKELSPRKKEEIYGLFSDYMDSTKHIFTLTELNDFLDKPENSDILRTHFKLWLSSTNALTNLMNNDIGIDSDALLWDIQESMNLFVKTSAFDQAIDCLKANNVLIIIGNPGVGKSITSKMVVLNYVAQGYHVRYTTDGADLAELKKAVSQSPQCKEIILLDDCFGQAYFSMKETQENELLALIKHIKRNTNKILVMNSRVTIYQEAGIRTPSLIKSLDCKDFKAFVLDVDRISALEKAKILYNHLYFAEIPEAYRKNILQDKNYTKIINHQNYNPRIVEFVTASRQYLQCEPSRYTEFILSCLHNPQQIWKNEFEQRITSTDRIFLTTLYALTNTTISLSLFRTCYEHRLCHTPGIDTTVPHFEQAINRLSGSMITVVDWNGHKQISAANPSVNDFICAQLKENLPERNQIIQTSCTPRSLKRLLSDWDYNSVIRSKILDKSLLHFHFESDMEKEGFLVYYCCLFNILDSAYTPFFHRYLSSVHDINLYESRRYPASLILDRLLEPDILQFYEIQTCLQTMPTLCCILNRLELDEAITFIDHADKLFSGPGRRQYIDTVTEFLEEAFEDYCSDVPAGNYDFDISSILEDCRIDSAFGPQVDTGMAEEAVSDCIKDFVLEDISDYISALPSGFDFGEDYLLSLYVSVSGCASLVGSFLTPGFDYDYHEASSGLNTTAEIDYLFNRW